MCFFDGKGLDTYRISDMYEGSGTSLAYTTNLPMKKSVLVQHAGGKKNNVEVVKTGITRSLSLFAIAGFLAVPDHAMQSLFC